MHRTKFSALLFASLLVAACGGDKPEPKTPETETTPAAAATTDMPAPSGDKTGTDTAATGDKPAGDATTTPAPAPEKPSLAVAAMKFTPKAKGKKIEVKADGSVMADGKAAGKIAGDHIEDSSGKALVTLGTDGALSGDNLKAGAKVSGDDVVADDGSKVTVGDDGTVTVQDGAGKPHAVGKFDNVGTAKKTAALIVMAWMMPHGAAAPAGKPAGKPGAKPAGKKK
jgi:hypothetical protein